MALSSTRRVGACRSREAPQRAGDGAARPDWPGPVEAHGTGAGPRLYDRPVNYELFMGEALAEAQLAQDEGEPPCAAVAVVDEAMVARARDRVRETGDPTAHAVMGAIREAARRLGRERLADVTIFTTIEPCPMCVGALLQADIETLVFAAPDLANGAAGGAVQLAQSAGLPRRLRVVSGIRREEVEELRSRVVVRATSNGRPTAS